MSTILIIILLILIFGGALAGVEVTPFVVDLVDDEASALPLEKAGRNLGRIAQTFRNWRQPCRIAQPADITTACNICSRSTQPRAILLFDLLIGR